MLKVDNIYNLKNYVILSLSETGPRWKTRPGFYRRERSSAINILRPAKNGHRGVWIFMQISLEYAMFNWWRRVVFVRRAGLLLSQQDFEWRWSVPLFQCLTVLEFSFILFDLCLLITFFNFIMNYVPIVTFWIFTYHKIWILPIMFCFIWSYWIIYFLACF